MKNICVYCSSSNDLNPDWHALATDLGTLIGQHGDRLVWGGGRVGLMGDVARATREAGGQTFGVIPESMTDKEIADYDSTELVITKTMRERKQLMDEKADAFVVLPGGFGTLEELVEVHVLKILGYHNRPIVMVNPDGFYDPLRELFDHFVEQGMAKPKHLAMLHWANHAAEVYELLRAAQETA